MALLVGANLVPLVGVLLLDWSLTTLVALHWLENGVVGGFAVGRILTSGSVPPAAPPTRGSSVLPNPMVAASLGLVAPCSVRSQSRSSVPRSGRWS